MQAQQEPLHIYRKMLVPGLFYWDEFKPLIRGQFQAERLSPCVILFVLPTDCPVVCLRSKFPYQPLHLVW